MELFPANSEAVHFWLFRSLTELKHREEEPAFIQIKGEWREKRGRKPARGNQLDQLTAFADSKTLQEPDPTPTHTALVTHPLRPHIPLSEKVILRQERDNRD